MGAVKTYYLLVIGNEVFVGQGEVNILLGSAVNAEGSFGTVSDMT